jgi:hypothetical protein
MRFLLRRFCVVGGWLGYSFRGYMLYRKTDFLVIKEEESC